MLFLEFSCFFYDPVGVGNSISDSSAFSKSSLYIWKFSVHILLKPSSKKFEYYLVSMWNEHNCMIVWTFYGLASLCDWSENWPQSCGHCWVFQICWQIECSTFTASAFRISNSSTGIPSPPLALRAGIKLLRGRNCLNVIVFLSPCPEHSGLRYWYSTCKRSLSQWL